MVITEVRIVRKLGPRVVAVASVNIENAFVLRGFRVIRDKDKFSVAMPRRKRPGVGRHEVDSPASRALLQMLEEPILQAYFDGLGGSSAEGIPAVPPAGPDWLSRKAARAVPTEDSGSPAPASPRHYWNEVLRHDWGGS